MGFLEARVSLDGTKFKQEVLAAAQKFLVEAITRHDPEWLNKPEGPLSWYWKREDVEAVCFLINFADTFGTLQHNITAKSVSVYIGKFKELLRAREQRQFKETLLELQFARALCERVSPIAFEPFVPAVVEDPGKKPRSPDCAIRLPDGDVQIEITTFYFGALERWVHATELLSEQFRNLLEKRKASRTINVIFPLEFDSLSLLSRDFLMSLIDEITKTERGKKNILIRRKKGALEWQPMLVFDKSNQTFHEASKEKLSLQ